jgi:hypothetical protein
LGMVKRWPYRSRQFFTALLGRVSKSDMAEARRVLAPGLYKVFEEMPGQYRHHALTVYRRLRWAGCDDPDVCQAALLHDSGKFDPASGVHVTIVHRVLVVLLEVTPPGRRLLERLSQPVAAPHQPADTLSRVIAYLLFPFYLSKHHASLGAERAALHGASPKVVQLISHHHRYRGHDPALLALQAADEGS